MSETQELTYKEVSEHTTKKDLYLVIHDKVYNVSSFIDEHPYVPQENTRAGADDWAVAVRK